MTHSAPSSDDYVTQVMQGRTDPPSVARTLGARITRLDKAEGLFECTYQGSDALLNPAGQVQGGMLAAMLDDVTAMLVTATLAPGEHCATLNLNMSFLRSANVGPIEGFARFERRGRDICNVTGELRQGGKKVAVAAATCMVVRPR